MATVTNPSSAVAPPVPPVGDVLYEVVDGQIVELPPMGAYPVWLASFLTQSLGPFATAQGLGRVVTEMLFRLDPATNLQRRPDVAFVSYERWPQKQRIPDDAAWNVIPDLAVEVVSPTNSATEVATKIRDYFLTGVRQIWVVYPDLAQVFVHDTPITSRTLNLGDELDGGDLLLGFRLPLARLFEDKAT